MPKIRGFDSLGKEHWLQQSMYWGEKTHAYNFTPADARTAKFEITTRNAYLPLEDRVQPEIVK